jgi:hypothetical protein
MDEPKKSTPSAADSSSEAHTGIPKAGNVTPGTIPNAADLTENELEDVVGGVAGSGTLSGGTGGATIFGGSPTSVKRGLGPSGGGGH